MDEKARELLIRAVTYIEIAQAMVMQNAPKLIAEIQRELQVEPPAEREARERST